ncbi:MAG: hypothetical protein M3N14_09915 [Bacteroidota bacterium]|nr:hypothetical protein [Bacteroidota bacterium]
MKFSLPIILTVILFTSCSRQDKNQISSANNLIYKTNDSTADDLSAKLELSGDIPRGNLTARLKLTNSGSKVVSIQEISIATTESLRSFPEAGNVSFPLNAGGDSTLSLKFHPLNDLRLYEVSGLQGGIKPVYNLTISYKTAGDDKVKAIALKSEADKDAYQKFTRKYNQRLTGYLFNTKTGFNQQQTKYLESLKPLIKTSFVYLSEHEIAIAGLNFRLKSYLVHDTLHADLFAVNHAEFAVKIVPEAFDIVSTEKDDSSAGKTLSLERLSGMQHDAAMIEKGDRVVIHLKKYLKSGTPGKEKLTVYLRKAFILTGRKNLFIEDVELLPARY